MEGDWEFSGEPSATPLRFPKRAAPVDDVGGLDDEAEEQDAQRKKVLGLNCEIEDEKESKTDFHEAIKLADALSGLVGKSLYSDCVFVVGKDAREIPAHRIVLAACSRVFEHMLFPNAAFDGASDESTDALQRIAVPDVEPQVFLALLQGVYTDRPQLTEDTVGGVIKAAKKYQLEKVQLACALFLEQGVTKENAMGLFNRAEELSSDPNLALAFVEKWATALIQQPAFVALKKHRLQHLLKSDKLAVEEVSLFKAVVRWGQAECKRLDVSNAAENVRRCLDGVVQLIRFPTMSLTDLATQVVPAGVLTQAETLELFQYLGSKDKDGKSPFPTSFPTKGRVAPLSPAVQTNQGVVVWWWNWRAGSCRNPFRRVIGPVRLSSRRTPRTSAAGTSQSPSAACRASHRCRCCWRPSNLPRVSVCCCCWRPPKRYLSFFFFRLLQRLCLPLRRTVQQF